MTLFPDQLRSMKGAGQLWIGNFLQGLWLAEGGEMSEFLTPSGHDQFSEVRIVIREEEKRSRRSPLLAHEKHGSVWRETKQRLGRSQCGRQNAVRQALTECVIARLIVI